MLLGLIKLLYSYNRCFAIELLALQTSNIKLYQSRRYCSYLTHFRSMFPFIPAKNIKKSVFLMFP